MAEQDDLIDYSSDEEQAVAIKPTKKAAAAKGAKGAAAKGKAGSAPVPAAASEEDGQKKGSYVGIHATGFRDFLLKPELLNAIGECGFEHPSEGRHRNGLFFALYCIELNCVALLTDPVGLPTHTTLTLLSAHTLTVILPFSFLGTLIVLLALLQWIWKKIKPLFSPQTLSLLHSSSTRMHPSGYFGNGRSLSSQIRNG